MKKLSKEVWFGVLLTAVLFGILIWSIRMDPGRGTKIIVIFIISIIILGLYIWNVVMKKSAIKNGQNPEDEFIKLAKIHAGATSFQYSMVLWWFIFIMHDTFDSRETMLGVGILGSAAIYGLVYWYYKVTSTFQ